jgi:phosphoadenosine phosphosulfate reductase
MNNWNINLEFDLPDFLAAVADEFGEKAAFSSSLSFEDQVVTHHIFSQNLPIRVFTLDTGRIFPETYAVLQSTRERYGQSIEVFFPDTETTQKLVSSKGPSSFYESLENRKECCHIRKIEPLNRALQNVECWLTGLRAEHSENRSKLAIVEWDPQRQLHKVNPLANWTFEEVKAEIKKHNIPYNVLHDRGFVSIGCQPCTRPVKEGEDFRAGRWWWESSNKKECGLHG